MANNAKFPQRYTGDPHSTRFRGITLGRLYRFEGGEYGDMNLTSALFIDRTDASDVISMQVWDAPGRSKPTFAEAVRAKGYRTLKKGDSFGPIWSNHWVKMTIKVPENWKKYERVQLEFDPSCEAMIFNSEGVPLQGITGGYGGDRRVEYILDEQARKFAHHIYIEVTCNGMFGLDAFEGDRGYDSRTFRLNSADLVAPRQEAWHLLWDFRVIRDLAKVMPDQSPLQHHALTVAQNITNIFRHDDLSTIALCRKEAQKVIGEITDSKVYDDSGNSKQLPQVWAIGNCHIDTAWLWPFSATQQKTARSWSTQLDLMERYPEYRFVASQAQQFKWLEQQYPALFEKIKAKVTSGQFQPIGGCWVEMDTNLPSGEALCRQMIFGQRYFKSRFGKYCETLWLPDTFGYSCQLPQIARLAGMSNFFTQKLSWSQFNTFPHTTFSWVGIDGSQVLTHMPPVNTYTAQATVNDVKVSISTHKSLQVSDLAILPFGNGDGGGGPLAPMLETLRRIRGTAENSRDIPKVQLGKSVDDFFHQVLANSETSGNGFATWIGELYFEYHRGTYTSHASIKNHNRRSEILMRDIEMTATLASLASEENSKQRYVYPKEEIDSLWEDLLLCQFHDVLPGSAIEMVYRDAEAIYHNLAVKGHALLQKALAVLHPASTNIFMSTQPLSTYYAVNTSGRSRAEVVALKGIATNSALSQAISKDEYLVLFADEKGEGIATPRMVHAKETGQPKVTVMSDGSHVLANDRLAIVVSTKGRITSILDIHNSRELVDQSSTAGFVLFEDTPNAYDAWDADIAHLEKRTNLEGQVMIGQQGPLRSSLLMRFRYKQSEIETTISLDHSSTLQSGNSLGLIRFSNHVHWSAKHEFLKFELPTTLRCDSAIYDAQFGVLSRPTHRNTTWDAAKFEVCGHKFADLSEFGYGLAIVNNNKYGYAVANNVMRLSLLRASTYPDRHQDEGTNLFDFAIYPHACHFMQSDVPEVARHFNAPFHVRRRSANAHAQILGSINPISLQGPPNLVLETIKRGDDDDFVSHKQRSVVVRIFDAYGGAAHGNLVVKLPIKKAAIVDLLERDIAEIDISSTDAASKSYRLPIRLSAFQVLTVKLELS